MKSFYSNMSKIALVSAEESVRNVAKLIVSNANNIKTENAVLNLWNSCSTFKHEVPKVPSQQNKGIKIPKEEKRDYYIKAKKYRGDKYKGLYYFEHENNYLYLLDTRTLKVYGKIVNDVKQELEDGDKKILTDKYKIKHN